MNLIDKPRLKSHVNPKLKITLVEKDGLWHYLTEIK